MLKKVLSLLFMACIVLLAGCITPTPHPTPVPTPTPAPTGTPTPVPCPTPLPVRHDPVLVEGAVSEDDAATSYIAADAPRRGVLGIKINDTDITPIEVPASFSDAYIITVYYSYVTGLGATTGQYTAFVEVLRRTYTDDVTEPEFYVRFAARNDGLDLMV